MGESDRMLNSVLNGDWGNSVPGRQFKKGAPGHVYFLNNRPREGATYFAAIMN